MLLRLLLRNDPGDLGEQQYVYIEAATFTVRPDNNRVFISDIAGKPQEMWTGLAEQIWWISDRRVELMWDKSNDNNQHQGRDARDDEGDVGRAD